MQNQNKPFLTTTEETGQTGTPRKAGRKPLFTDEVQREAIRVWEQRDSLPPGMKLDEFLAEKFGRAADGALVVPPNTFLGWRKKFMTRQVTQS